LIVWIGLEWDVKLNTAELKLPTVNVNTVSGLCLVCYCEPLISSRNLALCVNVFDWLTVNGKQLLDAACSNALLKVNLRLALRMYGADKCVSGYQLCGSSLAIICCHGDMVLTRDLSLSPVDMLSAVHRIARYCYARRLTV